MKYVIDEEVVQRLGLTLPELFALLLLKTSEDDIYTILALLRDKEAIITENRHNFITKHWDDICNKILRTSENYVPSDEELEPLALELMSIFPEGKKEGTPYYWRCNKREIILKLKSFFRLYGNTYTDEQIINAAKTYVTSFNGDYKFMRLLKYFIWKREDGTEISELATFVDNEGQESDSNDNWVTELK